MFDLLLYVELIYWVTALPLHLRCLLTGRELPCVCTHYSPGEMELLHGYKVTFYAQQLGTARRLVGEILWHLLIPSNRLKRYISQINLFCICNGNVNTMAEDAQMHTLTQCTHTKNSKKIGIKYFESFAQVFAVLTFLAAYRFVKWSNRWKRVPGTRFIPALTTGRSRSQQGSTVCLQHPWVCHLYGSPQHRVPSCAEHVPTCSFAGRSPPTSTQCLSILRIVTGKGFTVLRIKVTILSIWGCTLVQQGLFCLVNALWHNLAAAT